MNKRQIVQIRYDLAQLEKKDLLDLQRRLQRSWPEVYPELRQDIEQRLAAVENLLRRGNDADT